MAEELQALARRPVRRLRRLYVDALRPERVVERVLRKAARVERTRDELPERLEILEHRFVGIIVMRRSVVHVGGEPQRVADAGMLDEGKEVGDLELPAARRTVSLRHSL